MEAGGDVGGRAGRERPRPADPAAGTPVLPDPSELPREVREGESRGRAGQLGARPRNAVLPLGSV